MDQETKCTILHSILSFVDEFYYDDETGKTFFGCDIADTKSNVTYVQLLEQTLLTKANVIPVRNKEDADEEEAIYEWVGIATAQNQKENCQFWG